MEVSETCVLLVLLGLTGLLIWVEDALDQLLLLGELVFRGNNESLPLF